MSIKIFYNIILIFDSLNHTEKSCSLLILKVNVTSLECPGYKKRLSELSSVSECIKSAFTCEAKRTVPFASRGKNNV